MMSSIKFLGLCGALAVTLAGCMKDETAEAVAMGQFKNACSDGDLQACSTILTREDNSRAIRAMGTTTGASSANVMGTPGY